jgi:2-succinyl-6-hydroxy-2,4-cyclohexadiene-1-carboxylate synthase
VSTPRVLLHGFTGSPESWDAVRRELDRPPDPDPDLLTPAALGHDGTPGSPTVVTFEDEVDRLAGWVTDRVDGPVHLAGYSMGGRLALGLLVRHPGLVRSATLIGVRPGLTDASERADRRRWEERWARLLETGGLDTFVAAWEALPLFGAQTALDPAVVQEQRRIRRSHDADGLARSLRVTGLGRMPDYRPRLRDVRCPVRLVAGERDRTFRALAADMQGLLPRATTHVVPDAGHNVVLARPDIIAALLRGEEE